jgi:hypothetical protein
MIQRLVHWLSMKLYQNHYPLFTLTRESCMHTCKRKDVNNSCGSDEKFEGLNPLFESTVWTGKECHHQKCVQCIRKLDNLGQFSSAMTQM